MTARTEKGISCFLVPKWLPDGRPNNILIQQLKSKLGNQSNASSEIELYKAKGYLVGEEGRGIPTIMRMVNFSRLDCALGSAGLMRQALTQAIHHARNRSVSGVKLIDKPAMQNKLADLALESEAATVLVMRLARAMDESETDPEAAALARIGTVLAKFWVCEQAPNMIKTAAEALGGKGYVEESILPRLFRESLVNIIWEGTGVVNCLDVVQRNLKDPAIVKAFFNEVEKAEGLNPDFDNHLSGLKQALKNPDDIEYRAQEICEQLALALQASLLLRFSPAEVSEAFCASRLGNQKGKSYGTLRMPVDAAKILNRAFPT